MNSPEKTASGKGEASARESERYSPRNVLTKISRTLAALVFLAANGCQLCEPDRDAARKETPADPAPGAPPEQPAGYEDTVAVVERLAKLAEDKDTILMNNAGRLILTNNSLCPGVNGFALEDVRLSPVPGGPIPIPTHPGIYVMRANSIRTCGSSRVEILDGDIIQNSGDSKATYRKLHDIFIKLMAKLGFKVDPEPWNSKEARDTAKMYGVATD